MKDPKPGGAEGMTVTGVARGMRKHGGTMGTSVPDGAKGGRSNGGADCSTGLGRVAGTEVLGRATGSVIMG